MEFGPKKVDGDYFCASNQLTSLEFCATKIMKNLFAQNNLIENLKGIHKQFKDGYVGDTLSLFDNPLKSHLLGVILIPRLQHFSMNKFKAQQIINTHLKERDVLECQEELIQNGFKEFAQL